MDNWGYVLAAYLIGVTALIGYVTILEVKIGRMKR